ncbi:MAG: class I SAM-dependent methyltransferase [Polyangiaceae bacterium]|nr:class I SAM-dependent methyltransferase [Polyangiaceae bacterium]
MVEPGDEAERSVLRAVLPADALLRRATSSPAGVAGVIARALLRRRRLLLEGETDAVRIVHEDADDLPGCSIDLYGPYAVVSRYEERARVGEAELAGALLGLGVRGVYTKRRPRHASVLGDAQAGVAPPQAIAGDDAPGELEIVERGRRLLVRLGDGLSTGVFLDLRGARARVAAEASGARFLNLFAYTGAYSVAAGAGGARATSSVDTSRLALARAADNLRRNGLATPVPHRTFAEDALSFLARARVRGDAYELVALDPPSFSTTKGARLSVAHDYVALATAAMSALTARGVLFASTNHRGVDARAFEGWLRRAALGAGRRIARLEALPPEEDFPALPRGPALKAARIELGG